MPRVSLWRTRPDEGLVQPLCFARPGRDLRDMEFWFGEWPGGFASSSDHHNYETHHFHTVAHEAPFHHTPSFNYHIYPFLITTDSQSYHLQNATSFYIYFCYYHHIHE